MPHQPLGVDHGPDVVEDDAGDRAGPRRAEQHRQDAAARGAEEDRRADLERGDDREHVGELDRKRIVVRIRGRGRSGRGRANRS